MRQVRRRGIPKTLVRYRVDEMAGSLVLAAAPVHTPVVTSSQSEQQCRWDLSSTQSKPSPARPSPLLPATLLLSRPMPLSWLETRSYQHHSCASGVPPRALRGWQVDGLLPRDPGRPSPWLPRQYHYHCHARGRQRGAAAARVPATMSARGVCCRHGHSLCSARPRAWLRPRADPFAATSHHGGCPYVMMKRPSRAGAHCLQWAPMGSKHGQQARPRSSRWSG